MQPTLVTQVPGGSPALVEAVCKTFDCLGVTAAEVGGLLKTDTTSSAPAANDAEYQTGHGICTKTAPPPPPPPPPATCKTSPSRATPA